MDLGLTDHRVLVCGASRGLGAATARALAQEGARVAVAARASEELQAVSADVGGVAIPADLSTADGAAGAVRDAVAAMGGLDALLVNSGGPPPTTFEETSDEAWQKAVDGTLFSTIRVIREALPHLKEGRDPSIAIILSSSVREPIPGLITSNVIRPGLAGLIKTLVTEIAPVRINGLAPGRIGTDRIKSLDAKRAADANTTPDEIARQTISRIPLGRYGEPEELGRVATFLLSPAASYLTGVIVPVDGGMIKSLP
jgi:3-oxoacyl-[acyl-carrier protein] reductase